MSAGATTGRDYWREAQRRWRERLYATETPEEREARLVKRREYERQLYAARKARAAERADAAELADALREWREVGDG